MRNLSIVVFLALAIISFIGCGDGDDSSNDGSETSVEVVKPTAVTYIINVTEDRDIPTTANMLARTTETKVKITRDIESTTMNVLVLSGSVEVTE